MLRDKSKLLVEHIINNNNVDAESLFKTLITEIEARRELNIKKHSKLILEAEEDELDMDLDMDLEEDSEANAEGDSEGDTEDTEVDFEDDLGDLEAEEDIESTAEDIDANGDIEGDAEADAEEIVDTTNDITDINCEVNSKVISILFDKLAEIKSKVNALNLDPSTREAIKYSVTIEYYSDKLLDLQSKTTPETDQSRVEEALNAIEKSLDSLLSELGANDSEEFDEVKTPEEVIEDEAPEIGEIEDDDIEEEVEETEEEQESNADIDEVEEIDDELESGEAENTEDADELLK
jgi:hypothetical protein